MNVNLPLNERSRRGDYFDAGLLIRAWAYLLDFSLCLICVPIFVRLSERIAGNVLSYFAKEALLGEGVTQELVSGCLAALGISLLFSFMAWSFGSLLFFAILESFTGASPGKHLLGLAVITGSGERPPLWRSIFRQGAKSVSSLLLGIGFLYPLWSHRKQALHDKIAACYVVNKNKPLGFGVAFAVLLSVGALTISYPKISSALRRTQHQIQTIRNAYRSLGPVAQVAWNIVNQGLQQLREEAEREARSPAPPGAH